MAMFLISVIAIFLSSRVYTAAGYAPSTVGHRRSLISQRQACCCRRDRRDVSLRGRRSNNRRRRGAGTSSSSGEIENRGRKKRPSRRGRRGGTTGVDICRRVPAVLPSTTTRMPPSYFRRSSLRIKGGCNDATDSFSDIIMCHVDDREWWASQTESNNPYGTRAWPSALAVARLLNTLPSTVLNDRPIVEIGCGTGLVSITAAMLGASVLATDISPLALELTRHGWEETTRKIEGEEGDAQLSLDDSSGSTTKGGKIAAKGTLSTRIFDAMSSEPLPISRDGDGDGTAATDKRPILIATSVLYESNLATYMARRVIEALKLGAWVILGDCDSGNRENGREQFEIELDRRLVDSLDWDKGASWAPDVVRCPELGWTEKNVRLLQLNAPQKVTNCWQS